MKRDRHNRIRWSVPLLGVLLFTSACAGSGTRAASPQGSGEVRPAPAVQPAVADARPISADPAAIPGPVGRREPTTVRVDLETREVNGRLADGITYRYWTYNGTVPGPMLRVRQGDTVELHIKNAADSGMNHSIDLHAVTGPGGGAVGTQVKPGEEKVLRFKAMNPGVYVYHCATPYIPAHIANGMYGLIVVEPPEGLAPADREFYVMQGEFYTDLKPGQTGHANYDGEALAAEEPNFVVFNGAFQALTGEKAMRAKVGDRIRIFIGNGGPNLISSFHVIGEIFDKVHKEGASEATRNVQTTLVPAGGAAWVEFTVDVPGTYALVDHSISRALGKGAVAQIVVEGDPKPEIFDAPGADGNSH